MRIGINGRFLVVKQTGVQRTAYNLITSLFEADPKNEYFLFTGEEELKNKEWQRPNVTLVPAPIRSGSTFRNLWWEQFGLLRLLTKYKIDILHSPANMGPLFYRGKSIIHIHDLCFVLNPQWYSFTFRTWYNFVVPILAKRATKIVTNSNNSKNDLLYYFGINPNKVSLIYWALDKKFQKALKKNEIYKKEPFILYVGSLEPRKNIRNLLEAYILFREKNPTLNYKLVLIGAENSLFAHLSLNVKSYKDDILFKGFISDEALIEHYKKATLVVYPSLYEGFGLPPLEAMAAGTPVITSMISSIPEVVGQGAIKINPYDVSQIAEAILLVINDKVLYASLVEKGYKQVEKFNWNRTVWQLMAIFYSVYYGRDLHYEEWLQIKSECLLKQEK